MAVPIATHQIKAALRQMHPEDREKALKSLVTEPLKQATAVAKQTAAFAANKAEQLEKKVQQLKDQVAASQQTLAVRQRMTPQDMRDALNGLFATYNFSPAEELVMMLKDPGHPFFVEDIRLRTSILQELNSYVMPKLKSTEIKGTVEHQHTVTILRIGADGQQTRELPEKRAIEIPAEVEVLSTKLGGNRG